MKKLITLLAVPFLFASCDKATQFEMDYNTEIEVEATSPLSTPFDILSPEVKTNAEAEFQANETAKDHVEYIELRDLELTILSPSDQNFDFLKSIELFINADGVAEQRIAYKNEVPEGQDELILETVSTDLKEYIKSESFELRVETVTDESYTEDIRINVYSNFFVDAKIVK